MTNNWVDTDGIHLGASALATPSFVRIMATEDAALNLHGGPDGLQRVRIHNVEEAHQANDAPNWGQVIAATDNSALKTLRTAPFKMPCFVSSQGALVVISAAATSETDGEAGTLTITDNTSFYNATDGTWAFGGVTLTDDDAANGVRILLRHGIRVGENGGVDHTFNGIYYLAEGHGFGGGADTSFMLTRAADMGDITNVIGSVTCVVSGADAGNCFAVTTPRCGTSGFDLGTHDVLWSPLTGNGATNARAPCYVASQAALAVASATDRSITFPAKAIQDGTWAFGGVALGESHAQNGTRILIRHAVTEGPDPDPDPDPDLGGTKYCGIYYFAEMNGFSSSTPTQFTLTRAADMNADHMVHGSSVLVVAGTSAGKVFYASSPVTADRFTLGDSAMTWTMTGGYTNGAGIRIDEVNVVTMDLTTLTRIGASSLGASTTFAINADGASGQCSMADLAALEQTLSNKTIENLTLFGNVVVANDTILKVGTTDMLSFNADKEATITAHGTLVVNAVLTSSDESLYTDVNLCQGLDSVRRLRGVSWNQRGTNVPGIGVVAQEAQSVVPVLVTKGHDGTLAVQYNGLIGILINAVNELATTVEALKKKL